MNKNCLEIISCNKKKLNIGNNKVIAKMNICKSLIKMLDKLSFGKKPPEDTLEKARLTESKSLKSIKLYKNITKIVEIK